MNFREEIHVIAARGRCICTGAQVANAGFGAQSGKVSSQTVTLGKPCAKTSMATQRKRHRRRHRRGG